MAARTISRRGNRRTEEDYDPQDGTNDGYDDEEQDERPARRSRRSRDDEDEKPRGRSRRSRDEDDEEDEKPRGRRSRRDDDEEEERPRRTSRRSRDDDEDEDEKPRGKRGPIKSTAGRGWGGYDKVKDSGGGDFAKSWSVPEEQTLIKFLEPEPFSTYAEHWLEGRKGKRSFVCLGDDCPLCDSLGDRPRGYAMFNVLDLSDPDNPTVEAWKVGRQVANIIKEYADDAKTTPLDRTDLYFSVKRTKQKNGKGTTYNTILNPVKARDLDEDWDVEPFSEKELAEFEDRLHDEEQHVFISPRKDLKAIAAEYDD